ncbi:MAG: hypothetical protein Q9181_004785 [Wetmoreana brouardii]
MEQYRSLDASSEDDILEEPALHTLYRVSGNSPHFQESMSATCTSHLDDLDVMGETLLFKAVKRSDSALDDVAKLVNNAGTYSIFTPLRKITNRRIQNGYWKRWREITGLPPDKDSEEVYQVFTNLIQKILDDHCGLETHRTTRSGSKSAKRIVPFPREGSWSWDLVEEVTHFEPETESDNETWEDALE